MARPGEGGSAGRTQVRHPGWEPSRLVLMPVRAGWHPTGPGLTRCEQTVTQLAERAGITRTPRVRRAEWYRSDIRTAETRVRRRGRATIVVSHSLLDATEAERRGVLAHEMCHARWDRPGLA